MSPLKIFVSHSHHEREIAGSIKEELSRFGAQVFVAHEDINPTEDWQTALLTNLRSCDVFLALMSDEFVESDWTDQETGIAIALGKAIVPIKLNRDPYGFIGKFQALKWDSEEPQLSSRKLVQVLFDKKLLTIDNLILGFSNSFSYEDAGLNAELLASDIRFSKEQIDSIMKFALENNQIRSSWSAQPYLNKLFSTCSDMIDPKLMRKWKAQ